jgi:hypothetical protein
MSTTGPLSLVDKGRALRTKPEYVRLIVVNLRASKGYVSPGRGRWPRLPQQTGVGKEEGAAPDQPAKVCPANRYNLMTSNGHKRDADYVRLIGVNSR